MHALGPLLFPNSGWAPTGECESYKLVGDSHNNDTFLDFPVPKTYGVVHHQTSLGVPVLSEGNGLNNNSVVIKKLNHNAKERNRRQKANSLFSSLRSCLPRSDQSKKLSNPETVSRSVQYIPDLQEEVKKLIQKKEDLLVRVSDQRERYVKPQPKMAASYFSTVFATNLIENEVTIQISSSKIHNFSICNVLSGLEEDGFVILDVSSSSSQGERLFYTLHLQIEKIDNYKLICEDLSQRVLYLYEKCGNLFK
ncbi:Transcription factor ORG2 [Raphanus sativus]|uniref:Transcription factor ORG3-like n=1 Tax=Raphanus sativus TaxID=3726 RepID=A0A6J0NYG9_RAPSA|nr:transcription factor ORG3-like [Raphanus sativus]KAJ4896037.1 Transcription factor ORG2 [Raphanus sativus]